MSIYIHIILQAHQLYIFLCFNRLHRTEIFANFLGIYEKQSNKIKKNESLITLINRINSIINFNYFFIKLMSRFES
jgi:hypothetical protein